MHERPPRTSTGVTTSDALDWDRACSGDPTAFATIFDRHHNRVYGHALRLVTSVHDAEDVVAVSFLELWRRRADVRLTGGSVLPWLLVTCTNVAFNQRRANRRYRQFLARLPHPSVEPAAETAALAEATLGIDPRLREEIRALSDPDRTLLVLVGLEDRPLTEAAMLLGISHAAARSRWQRLRTRLADRLEPRTLPAALDPTALDPTALEPDVLDLDVLDPDAPRSLS